RAAGGRTHFDWSGEGTSVYRCFLLLAACGALSCLPPAVGDPRPPGDEKIPTKPAPPRTDRFGDPLPPGAVARLGTPRMWHRVGGRGGAFTDGGKALATGGLDGDVRVWDLTTGKEVRSFAIPKDGSHSLRFSADGRFLASGGGYHDQSVRLWDVATGKLLGHFRGHKTAVDVESLSANGKTLLTWATGETHRVWDLATGMSRPFPGLVGGLALSPDGKVLAAADWDRRCVRLYDSRSGKELRQWPTHPTGAHTLAFAPDGKALATAESDHVVRLRDPATGKELRRFAGP